MGLKKALKGAAGKVKKAVTAPVKATKQLAKGDIKGSFKTARGGARAAMSPVTNAVTAPIRANKQLLKGNVGGALRTAARGAVGAPPPQVAPVGQGGIAQDIFAGAPAPVPAPMGAPAGGFGNLAAAAAPMMSQVMRGGGFTGMGKAMPAPALATAAPAIGNMAGMLSGQFGAPAKKPMAGGIGLGGFDMGGGY